MMFTLNAFATFIILLSFTNFVSATDYRLLVNKPSCQTMDQFKFKWVFAISVHWITSPPNWTTFGWDFLSPIQSAVALRHSAQYSRRRTQQYTTAAYTFIQAITKERTPIVCPSPVSIATSWFWRFITWPIVAQALVFCVSWIISASHLIWCGKLVDSRSIRHTSTAPIIAFTLSPLSSLPLSADQPPEGVIHRRSNAVGT